MKATSTTLTWIIYAVLLGAVSVLINDFRELDLNTVNDLRYLKDTITAEENLSWYENDNLLRWNYRIIKIGLLLLKAYLIYGFTYLLRILHQVDKGSYFTAKVIDYFKKIGDILISYTIGLVILKALEAFITYSSFKFINEFKSELYYLIPCVLGFYVLADIFKRAQALKEENDLTV